MMIGAWSCCFSCARAAARRTPPMPSVALRRVRGARGGRDMSGRTPVPRRRAPRLLVGTERHRATWHRLLREVQHRGANVRRWRIHQRRSPWSCSDWAWAICRSLSLAASRLRCSPRSAGTVVSLGAVHHHPHLADGGPRLRGGACCSPAFVISLAPCSCSCCPVRAAWAKLLGKWSPLSASSPLASLVPGAWVVDVTGDYRVIWLFPAAAV